MVASSREDAWIETQIENSKSNQKESRPPARTRGLKLDCIISHFPDYVASSREDAWIETRSWMRRSVPARVASSREDAWIETLIGGCYPLIMGRSRPPARTRGLKLLAGACASW